MFVSGRHLKAARALAGMTQAQLAAAAKVHVNSVKYAERHKGLMFGWAAKRMWSALDDVGVRVDDRYIIGELQAELSAPANLLRGD